MYITEPPSPLLHIHSALVRPRQLSVLLNKYQMVDKYNNTSLILS